MNSRRFFHPAWALAAVLAFGCSSAWAQRGATDVTLSGRYQSYPSGHASEVLMRITSSDGVNFRARGAFAGKDRFDLPGLALQRNGDVVGLEFVGVLDLTGSGSGAGAGRTSMVLHILLGNAKTATGVYHLGKILPAIGWEQYGTMTLTKTPVAVRP